MVPLLDWKKMKGNTVLNSVQHFKPLKSSLLLSVCWLLFVIIWFFLFSTSFSIYANIGVFFLSLLIFTAIIGLIWFFWLKKIIPRIGWNFFKTIGVFNQIILTVLIPFMILFLLSVYLIIFADYFSFLQNISLVFISLLLIILGVIVIWKQSTMSPLQFVKQTRNPFTSFHSDDDFNE